MKQIQIRLIGCLILCLPLLNVQAQKEDFFYQVILESKSQYNNLDNKSVINPDNQMKFDEFTSISQIYPILRFKNQMNQLSTTFQAEGNVTNYNFQKDSTLFSFHELYAQFSYNDRHTFVIGKKRLDWGTGMIWNPTNFYVQKDPFRTQHRLEGINLLNYTYLLDKGTIRLYVFPESKLKDFSYAAKYDFTGERMDFSLSFLEYGKRQQFGADFLYGGDLFTAYGEATMRNFSKSYHVGEAGELLPLQNRSEKFWTEAVVGASVVLSPRFNARLEYRFREDYLNKQEVKLFEDHLPQNVMIYDPISISKHSLFTSLECKDLYDTWSVQLRTFTDPVSRQVILSPLLVLNKNYFQVELSSMFYNNALALFNSQTSLLISCYF